MAESVGKMKTKHGLAPDFALIDGPHAPLALKQDPRVQVEITRYSMATTTNWMPAIMLPTVTTTLTLHHTISRRFVPSLRETRRSSPSRAPLLWPKSLATV